MPVSKVFQRFKIVSYLLLLMGVVALAVVLPARGAAAPIVAVVANVAIGVLFFLYGARLTTQAIAQGIAHWRLQGLVLICTFVLFPALGEGLLAIFGRRLDGSLAVGLLFVCLLPSTVQSSIAFTSIARGNVPAALCCASLSNVLGVVVTPLLTAALLTAQRSVIGFDTLRDIFFQLLAPFALGQILRPWIGDWILRRKRLTSIFDRGSILLVVYEAFGAGVVAGVWSRIALSSLCLVLALDLLLLALVLTLTTVLSRKLNFSKEDEITIVFCGSKKSMASGIPMANILFPGATAGLVVIPLMLFHQAQLFACAFLAQRYAQRLSSGRGADAHSP